MGIQSKQQWETSDSIIEAQTEGVKILLGNPKKAIIKLALPMIFAMSVATTYNLIDAIWVSGLGANALAAVGFFYPFFFMAQGLSAGLGVGGGAAISRRIGGKDKFGADSVAAHTMVIMVLLTISFSLPLLILTPQIFLSIGAKEILDMVVSYGRIMFAGSFFIFFSYIANAILRAEGDAKRAMYAMMLGASLNIVLDPIFIYVLDLGINGAAWATVISMLISSTILSYWLFFRKDTYVSFHFYSLKFSIDILKDIFRVGLPSIVQQVSMALAMLVLNILIVWIGSTDGVAVFSAGWRVSMISTLPLLGMATAVVSVTGAAFGANDFGKISIVHLYAIKIGLIIETAIAFTTFILAPQISSVFTQAKEVMRIHNDLTIYLKTMATFYPAVAFGMLSSALFQGTGKGLNALIVTIIRTLILIPLFVILFAFSFNMGLLGVWLGIVIGNVIGSILAFSWVRIYINKNKKNPIKNY